MKHAAAHEIGCNLIRLMEPYCRRAALAGSVRREEPEVTDIDLVVIPTWGTRPAVQADLFGEAITEPVNLLFEQWQPPFPHEWILGHKKPDGRLWRAQLRLPRGPIQLEVHLTSPERWGIIHVIRTGPKEFGQALARHANDIGLKMDEGALWGREIDGKREFIPTPEEADVFAALGLEYVEPQRRIDASSLRGLGSRRAA